MIVLLILQRQNLAYLVVSNMEAHRVLSPQRKNGGYAFELGNLLGDTTWFSNLQAPCEQPKFGQHPSKATSRGSCINWALILISIPLNS